MNCYATVYHNGKRDVWEVNIVRELSRGMYLSRCGHVWNDYQLFNTRASAEKYWQKEYIADYEYFKFTENGKEN